MRGRVRIGGRERDLRPTFCGDNDRRQRPDISPCTDWPGEQHAPAETVSDIFDSRWCATCFSLLAMARGEDGGITAVSKGVLMDTTAAPCASAL